MPPNDYCIVVAEDDPILRYCTVTLLRKHGYKVIEAVDGTEALEMLENCDDRVHLLVTNFDMPRMNGVDLARNLKSRYDGLGVLMISGNAPDLDPTDNIETLPKPYSDAALARKVRQLLKG